MLPPGIEPGSRRFQRRANPSQLEQRGEWRRDLRPSLLSLGTVKRATTQCVLDACRQDSVERRHPSMPLPDLTAPLTGSICLGCILGGANGLRLPP